MTANWYPLKRIAEALDKRKWFWSFDDADKKYIDIRVDTRDNCCVVTFGDRTGKVFAKNIEEFEQVMKFLDEKNPDRPFNWKDFNGGKPL